MWKDYKQNYFLIVSLLLIGLGLFWLTQEKHSENDEPTKESIHPAIGKSKTAIFKTIQEEELSTEEIEAAISRELSLIKFPQAEVLAKEAKKNPHGTPPSIFRFSDSLADPMEQAFSSEIKAKKVAEFLAGCATRYQELPELVRSICLINHARLAEKFPSSVGIHHQTLRAGLSKREVSVLQSSGFRAGT